MRIKRNIRRGGGLLGITHKSGSSATPLMLPMDWTAPDWIDNRPYCLPANDQGRNPWCAAYAMACLIEAHRWRMTHVAKQIDPAPIYERAKQLDGIQGDGTTLEAVAEASVDLGLLPRDTFWRQFGRSFDDLCYALHSCGLVLLGFRVHRGWSKCNPRTGWIGPDDGSDLGGHAVAGCWYSRLGKTAGVGWQNSWANWGCNGFGRMSVKDYERTVIGGLAIVIP